MHYTHFTLDERKYLQQLLAEGLSFRKIADILERSPSTISREVNRNCSKFMPRKNQTTSIGTITGALRTFTFGEGASVCQEPFYRIRRSGILY